MPWKECDRVLLRKELVELMSGPGANVRELCRRFGVSRKTAYKWKNRQAAGPSASCAEPLADRSRRPVRSPKKSVESMEASVLGVRSQHPAWGGRKIARRLKDTDQPAPSPSTVTRILHRHGCISAAASEAATPWQRFEHAAPNDLWQMDFKGHIGLSCGRRCHPLTILDDHSRYSLGLFACLDEQGLTVQGHLRSVFTRYGLPRRILADNGPPWGVSHARWAYTKLELWLLRLNVRLLHGRPLHPQTQGKDERFHRSLKAEVLEGRMFDSNEQVQSVLDPWRRVYNHERPHEALGLATPSTRYVMSPRSMPRDLPELVYDEGNQTRRVNAVGRFQFRHQSYSAGEAFAGETIGLRRATEAGQWDVLYGRYRVGRLDETTRQIERSREERLPLSPPLATLTAGTGACVTHVSEQV
jgi:transposase InsO family protein